ncbi:helix-turn-helix transcriptional regulator [Acidisoma silvae]|uniref:Helix-turn-helix transcriptional regulator n=1 Tax=Acidisoma silvae TaxID=2802396 RepID=A0A963YVP2_9PROT|nr:helix-turn-helix transcriptional regulator [Acidisoma silvae]MCB8877721.1 helix-turn-helix transcriptional regulator [Acidisoma silvae]
MQQDPRLNPKPPDTRIEEVRRFALEALRATSSIFYWIDDRQEMQDVEHSGFSRQNFSQYQAGMKAYDPLNIARLVNSSKRVATLRQDHDLASPSDFAHYKCYLEASRISDVLDFVFWDKNRPFAGLGILKSPEDPPFCADTLGFAEAMQPYIEFNLAAHPRLQSQRLTVHLSASFKFTRREIEVTTLLRAGCTNHDVADELGISLGTVKTHVMRIFDKLGVENRASLVSRIAQVENETVLP